MTPTKVRSAAYRARKKVRDSDALVRLERYEAIFQSIANNGRLGAVTGSRWVEIPFSDFHAARQIAIERGKL